MNTPCNLPYFELAIDKNGNQVQPSQVQDILSFLTGAGKQTKDLFVMSHGWNNDETDARSLYERFFTQFCNTLAAFPNDNIQSSQCAVVGILWPSKKFADSSVIPGGAASLDDGSSADADLQAALDQLAAISGPDAAAHIAVAKQQISSLEDSPAAQRTFVKAILSLLPDQPNDEEGVQHLFEIDGDDLLNQLSQPLPAAAVVSDPDEGGGAGISLDDETTESEGGAQSLSSILSGIKGGALRYLNYTTYYLMKDRAGIVGRTGVAQALTQIQTNFPDLRIRPIGHSFGARVVTSATASLARPVASLTLLQAAFSHNSFSPDFDNSHKPGAFRSVVENGKIAGPMLITHSVKDVDVGVAYAIASRLALQNASAIGDENDPYGGLGRNGARHTPEATDDDLQPVNTVYSFQPGKIFNLKGDSIIMGHSDIVKPEIAYAFITSLAVELPKAAAATDKPSTT